MPSVRFVIRLLVIICTIPPLMSCERQREWTPLTVPLNIVVVKYEKVNPTFCRGSSKQSMYKQLEKIADNKERQLTFLLNLGLCNHKKGNILEARLNIMRVLHLAETYEDYPEHERIALSYFAESRHSNNFVDHGWANKKMLDRGYQNYGVTTEINSGLETARAYRANDAAEQFEKYLEETNNW